MSIYTDVLDFQGGKRRGKAWYRDQVRALLTPLDRLPAVGDVVFYTYSAATAEKLKFWDRFPMTLITDVNLSEDKFEGGNLHYLRPTVRVSVGAMIKAGGMSYPRRCHHKYFLSAAGSMYLVPKEELDSIGKLPLEQFTTSVMGRNIDMPSSHVWSRL